MMKANWTLLVKRNRKPKQVVDDIGVVIVDQMQTVPEAPPPMQRLPSSTQANAPRRSGVLARQDLNKSYFSDLNAKAIILIHLPEVLKSADEVVNQERGHHKKLKKHSRKVNRKRLNKTRRWRGGNFGNSTEGRFGEGYTQRRDTIYRNRQDVRNAGSRTWAQSGRSLGQGPGVSTRQRPNFEVVGTSMEVPPPPPPRKRVGEYIH